jgi:hypothetical protein
MYIKKVAPSSFNGKKHKTTYLWCSDGWTYDTTGKVRRKYEVVGDNLFNMIEEPYNRGVYSGVQYVERIEVILISESPKVWIEMGTDILDMFQETSGEALQV